MMNEAAARNVVMVRAVELADRDRTLWNDEERAWAGRAAAEVVGSGAPPEVFIARRAALALERLGARHPSLTRLMRAVTWRSWVGAVCVAAAFLFGIAVDQLAGGRRINILAPPLLALLAWNLAVYLTLVVGTLVHLARRGDSAGGPIRRWLARAARGLPPTLSSGSKPDVLGAITAEFSAAWLRLSTPLLRARVARVLHLAAAAFALGAVSGLYLRGLAFEYNAGWESTFLSAEAVHRLLAFVLAPGSMLTGIAIPDANQLAAIRFGSGSAENAAPWIHLYAATVAVVILIPRLAFASIASLNAERHATRFPLRLDEPYFQRLLRTFSERPLQARIVPYSYQVPEASVRGLRAVLERIYGARTEISWAEPVRYGEEETSDLQTPDLETQGLVVGLFSIAATPEAENQLAFLAQLRSHTGFQPLLVIVDEAGFKNRFASQPERLEERRATWRAALGAARVTPVFIDLAAPDLRLAETALEAALEEKI